MQKTIWKDQSEMILRGIILSSIAGGFYLVFQSLGRISLYVDLTSIQDGWNLDAHLNNVWFIWSVFALLLTVGGYILYVAGLSAFEKVQDENDRKHIRLLRNCVIVNLCGAIVWMIPWVGWFMMGILNLITFILMIITYNRLKNSLTFPLKAREGASLLFMAMLIQIVQIPVGLIPFWGAIIGGIVAIVSFVLMLCGWINIKNAEPITEKGKKVAVFSSFSQIPGGTRLTWGLVMLLLVYGVLLILGHLSNFIIRCDFWDENIRIDIFEKINTLLSHLRLISILVGFVLFYSAVHSFQRKGIISCGKNWVFVGTIIMMINILSRLVLILIGDSELIRVSNIIFSILRSLAWLFLAIAVGQLGKKISLTAKGCLGIRILQGCMWGIFVVQVCSLCCWMMTLNFKDQALTVAFYWGIVNSLYIIWVILECPYKLVHKVRKVVTSSLKVYKVLVSATPVYGTSFRPTALAVVKKVPAESTIINTLSY